MVVPSSADAPHPQMLTSLAPEAQALFHGTSQSSEPLVKPAYGSFHWQPSGKTQQKPLAIIPARGGSKRIPRKNIKPFCDKPILAYTIEAARQSGCFQEVMVSTDDTDIADLAQHYGATVPFLRDCETSHDMAMLADVLTEVLYTYDTQQGMFFPQVACLLPTSGPFLTSQRLQEGYTLLNTPIPNPLKACDGNEARSWIPESVVPMVPFGYPVWRGVVQPDAASPWFTMAWPQFYNTRSQDLPTLWHDAAQFYWFYTEALLQHRQLFMPRSIGLYLKEWEAQDIDTPDDWIRAELKYRALHPTP
ncbi:MAG: pseudaminic acid cytidylyltransferase [Vampirovibrionales bacterium]